jgi:hypothetical protein
MRQAESITLNPLTDCPKFGVRLSPPPPADHSLRGKVSTSDSAIMAYYMIETNMRCGDPIAAQRVHCGIRWEFSTEGSTPISHLASVPGGSQSVDDRSVGISADAVLPLRGLILQKLLHHPSVSFGVILYPKILVSYCIII